MGCHVSSPPSNATWTFKKMRRGIGVSAGLWWSFCLIFLVVVGCVVWNYFYYPFACFSGCSSIGTLHYSYTDDEDLKEKVNVSGTLQNEEVQYFVMYFDGSSTSQSVYLVGYDIEPGLCVSYDIWKKPTECVNEGDVDYDEFADPPVYLQGPLLHGKVSIIVGIFNFSGKEVSFDVGLGSMWDQNTLNFAGLLEWMFVFVSSAVFLVGCFIPACILSIVFLILTVRNSQTPSYVVYELDDMRHI